MHKEQLEKLQARVKEATETAALLELLEAGDPHKAGVAVSFRLSNSDALEYYSAQTLKDMIGLGRLEMIKRLEAKLAGLLGNESAAEESLQCAYCHRRDAKRCPICKQRFCSRCDQLTAHGMPDCTLPFDPRISGEGATPTPAGVLTVKGECPVCGFEEVARCRCPGPHTLAELMEGHGSECSQGHRWSGDVRYDPNHGQITLSPSCNSPPG